MGALMERPEVSRALAKLIQEAEGTRRIQLADAYARANTVNGLPKWAREALAAQGIT